MRRSLTCRRSRPTARPGQCQRPPGRAGRYRGPGQSRRITRAAPAGDLSITSVWRPGTDPAGCGLGREGGSFGIKIGVTGSAARFYLVGEGLPGAGREGQLGAVGVVAVADRHGRAERADLDAGSAVVAAVAARAPRGTGHVHRSSATFLIRSEVRSEVTRDCSSARSVVLAASRSSAV